MSDAPGTPAAPTGGRRLAVGALVAALAWLAVLVAVQEDVFGSRLVVVPWLALGPLAASLVLPWRATGVVAVASVLAVALLSADTGDLGSTQGAVRVLGSAALAAFAVLGSSVRLRREARVRRVTEVAVVAQAAILHPVPDEVGGLVMASRYASATTGALVGGDLYDVVAVGGGVRVVVGDARGKGLAALHTSAAVLSAFRHAAPRADLCLDEVALSIDHAVTPGLAPEDFVTAVLVEVRPDGRLVLVRCGHPAPLRLAPGREPVEVGQHSCPPMGLGVDPRVEHAVLGPGERLLLYTDGLVEARDASGRFFDLVAAAGALGPGRPPSAAALDDDLEVLFGLVRAHVGGTFTDDVAALLLQPLRAGATAGAEPGAGPGAEPGVVTSSAVPVGTALGVSP